MLKHFPLKHSSPGKSISLNIFPFRSYLHRIDFALKFLAFDELESLSTCVVTKMLNEGVNLSVAVLMRNFVHSS